jgi:RHS repeat-associated protein
VTTYSFDGNNRLSSLVNPFSQRTTWVYDAIGRVATMTHGNLSVAEHDYDAAGRISAVRNLKSDRSVISIFTYSYDSIGNRLGVAEANGDLVTWSYDEAYQLTREQRSGDNAYDTTFTYDGVGNRLTQVSSGATTTYSYDVANELLTSEDASGVTTFSYDASGNTTGEIRANGDLVTYTWDIENHLTKIELPASVVNTVTLDGDGKRRTIEDSDGLRNIIWDAENILAEVDSGGSTVAQYTLAPEVYGSLVSQRRSGATSFHHFDALGSTNKLTDADEATLIEYLYRAFGGQTVLSGSSANRFTWVGRLGYYRQPDPDDYWVRARIPQPRTGRWLTTDPARLGINLYAMSGNSPLVLVDPNGLGVQGPCYVCGPKIESALSQTLWKIVSMFLHASKAEQKKACKALWTSINSIDVAELHAGGPKTANCPSEDECNLSVMVNGLCQRSASVNYVGVGIAGGLCGWSWYTWGAIISAYALTRGPSYQAAALDWAWVGYNWPTSWPRVTYMAGAGCRECTDNCPDPWFGVTWDGLSFSSA